MPLVQSEFAQIEILASGNDLGQRFALPPLRIVQERAVEVINRKDQIVAVKLLLYVEKAFEFRRHSGR